MPTEMIMVGLDDGSEVAINLKNVNFIQFVPAEIGGKPHAEIHFAGRERPLGVSESVILKLRQALAAN